jgi:hypothetical protein
MEKRQTSKGSHRLNLRDVKLLIAAISIASVMGFWTIFSKQLVRDANNTTQTVLPEIQPTQGMVLDLPPIPTLIPNLEAQTSTGIPQVQNPASANAPTIPNQPTTKILLGGARPQPKSAAPAPVTRTRSSK